MGVVKDWVCGSALPLSSLRLFFWQIMDFPQLVSISRVNKKSRRAFGSELFMWELPLRTCLSVTNIRWEVLMPFFFVPYLILRFVNAQFATFSYSELFFAPNFSVNFSFISPWTLFFIFLRVYFSSISTPKLLFASNSSVYQLQNTLHANYPVSALKTFPTVMFLFTCHPNRNWL